MFFLKARNQPDIAEDFTASFDISFQVKELAEHIPDLESRKRFLAKDPLVSVEGFRAIVLLTYKYLFGMRVCADCPSCNFHENPCQDYFGSNATPEGGIFGQIDAGYTSVEAQKSIGALHAHSQLFVQCLHQHTPLHEVFKIIETQHPELVQHFCKYKAYVSRQVYCEPKQVQVDLEVIENDWPEYADYSNLMERPSYLTQSISETDDAIEEGKMGRQLFVQRRRNVANAETTSCACTQRNSWRKRASSCMSPKR